MTLDPAWLDPRHMNALRALQLATYIAAVREEERALAKRRLQPLLATTHRPAEDWPGCFD